MANGNRRRHQRLLAQVNLQIQQENPVLEPGDRWCLGLGDDAPKLGFPHFHAA